MDRSFKVFNIDKTKNRKVMRFMLLELEINGYMEKINVVVTDLNSINMFLGYNWLVKYNPEVNLKKEIIQFTRCLKECKIQHQDISLILRTKKIQLTEDMNKGHQEIGKKPDLTNPEDLPEYI